MTTALTWTPGPFEWPAADEDALILSQEAETFLLETITAEQSDEEKEEPYTLDWQAPDGLPLHCVITSYPTEPRLTVEVLDWIGVFPITIAYMKDGTGVGLGQTPEMTTQWEDLPEQQSDIYSYKASSLNVKRFRLVVTALNRTSHPIETVIYTITVYANYDLGRDALKKAVKKRSEYASS